MEIPYEKRFFFKDGSSAGTLEELYKKLEGMSYDEFYEHVNPEKNDFANWIEHILDNKELAEKLRLVNSMVETAELIYEELHPESHETIQHKIEEELFRELEKSQGETIKEEEEPVIQSRKEEVEEVRVEPFPPRRPIAPRPYEEEGEAKHYAVSEGEAKELVRFHQDVSRFMLREFIYGMLFGLVLGIIISRVISIMS